jgi:hypothetical protein
MALVAILMAAAAGFGVGAIWYSVFAEAWLTATGRTEEEIRRKRDAAPFLLAGIAALLAAGLMRHVFATAGVSGWGAGMVSGLGLGAFVVAPWLAMNAAFGGRPRALWWIDGGHATLAFGAMGLVLGLLA